MAADVARRMPYMTSLSRKPCGFSPPSPCRATPAGEARVVWPFSGARIARHILLFGCAITSLALWPGHATHAQTKRIFAVPPTKWDNKMSRDRPSLVQGPSDLAALTGGIVFGLAPSEVNAKLPTPAPGVEWAELPF